MLVLVLLGLSAFLNIVCAQYTPDWSSLDNRPLPSWYDEAKIGIFIHWGVFSAPGFGHDESAFLWNSWNRGDQTVLDFIKRNYPPGITYADFASEFKAEFYDPNEWAKIFQASGAKYVVLTSKHHEGFTNWPSSVSWNWNSKDVGPNRDLVGDLANAIRKTTDIHFGLYHSLFEWYNPLYLEDKRQGYKTQTFVRNKAMPELYEIVNAYKPEVIWSDGQWEASDTYWNSTNFLAWLYNESPVKDYVVTNDRWGSNTMCRHGGYYTCNDKYNPKVLQKRKWENCMTLDRNSWGYRRNLKSEDVLTMDELTTLIAETISCGGNILMNVGPTGYGTIPVIFEERLRQLGSWLGVNGEAVYSSKPWSYQNDTVTPAVWYTTKTSDSGNNIYAFVLDWPKNDRIFLGAPTPTSGTEVTLLGYNKPLVWKARPGGGVDIDMPIISTNDRPCDWAWVIRMTSLA